MYTKICFVISAFVLVCVMSEYHQPTSYISVSNHIIRDHGKQQFDYHDEESGESYQGDRDSDEDDRDGENNDGRHEFEEQDSFDNVEYSEEKHYPNYIYKYGVDDKHTKDFKTHQEHREGDSVKGRYTVLQPDGKTRVVHYTADNHNGFHAVVMYDAEDSEQDIHYYH